MTRYDSVRLPDGTLHPLSQVPEYVLDAATAALRAGLRPGETYQIMDDEDVEPVAHAVLAAAREAVPVRLPVPAGVQASMVITAVNEWARDSYSAAYLREIMSRAIILAEEGWTPFGYHADMDPCPEIEFSAETSEDGMPLYERPRLG